MIQASKALGFRVSSTAGPWNTANAGDQLSDNPYHVIDKEQRNRICEEMIMQMDSTSSPQIYQESKRYFNPYRGYSLPCSMIMAPFILLDGLFFYHCFYGIQLNRCSYLAKTQEWTGGAGAPLRVDDLEDIELCGIALKGWRIKDKILLPTPGCSPCSISILWPKNKSVFTSDADWIGNPLFVTSSLSDCITSLETLKDLTKAGIVDLYLPAHDRVLRGRLGILEHLDSRSIRLKSMRNEVLAVCHNPKKRKF